jgi:hypothetical protein
MHPWRHTLDDITVFSMPADRGIRAIPRPDVPAWAFRAGHGEDQALACLLITQWALLTGRTPRTDVPLHMLSSEELISFWADQRMTQDCAPQVSDVVPDRLCAAARIGRRTWPEAGAAGYPTWLTSSRRAS